MEARGRIDGRNGGETETLLTLDKCAVMKREKRKERDGDFVRVETLVAGGRLTIYLVETTS